MVEGFIISDVHRNFANGRDMLPWLKRGGCSSHKHSLLPIGHVTVSQDGSTVSADIDKARVGGSPAFKQGEFEKLSGDDFDNLDRTMATVTAGVAVTELDSHYRVPADGKIRHAEALRNQRRASVRLIYGKRRQAGEKIRSRKPKERTVAAKANLEHPRPLPGDLFGSSKPGGDGPGTKEWTRE